MIYDIKNRWWGHAPLKVTLDGKEIKHAIYADTEAGIVRHHGEKVELNADGVSIKVHEDRGKVEVTPL